MLKEKQIIFLIIGMFTSVCVYSQTQILCDSLFSVEDKIEESSFIVMYNESMPEPILKRKQREAYFNVRLSDKSAFGNSEYKVYVKFVVDVDSTAKCITILKSDDTRL